MIFKNYEFLRQSEGKRLTAYQDQGGVWTIGYGHTGQDVKKGMVIDDNQASNYLVEDVKWAETNVNKLITVEVNQNQFDALVSLAYNIGVDSFKYSTALRRLNTKDYLGAVEALTWWNKVDGKVNGGLISRRKKEKDLFLTPVEAQLPLPFPNREEQIRVLVDKFVKDLMEIK